MENLQTQTNRTLDECNPFGQTIPEIQTFVFRKNSITADSIRLQKILKKGFSGNQTDNSNDRNRTASIKATYI